MGYASELLEFLKTTYRKKAQLGFIQTQAVMQRREDLGTIYTAAREAEQIALALSKNTATDTPTLLKLVEAFLNDTLTPDMISTAEPEPIESDDELPADEPEAARDQN